MKKYGLLGFVLAVLVATAAWAAEPGLQIGGTYYQDYVNLPITAFQQDNGAPITAATAPGLEEDGNVPSLVWADGESSPAQISFMVPLDFDRDPRFKVWVTNSNVTTANAMDFDVYVNKDGSAEDSAATNQSVVTCDDSTAGYVDVLTLTPATDFDSLAPGNMVTLRVWRDDSASGNPTADLEMRHAVFLYTPRGY